MKLAMLGAVIITGAVSCLSCAAPVSAASLATNVLLNNLAPNLDFLDRSSRFALTNSKSPRVRDFAHSEAKEQTMAANVVDDWIAADKPQVVAAADIVQTGRSVAVDGQGPDMRLPMGQEDLDRLEGLNGKEFDDLYKQKQLDALTQIQTDYKVYIAQGDDPILVGLAKRELPKVERRLTELKRL